jgi:hypothetical protein
MKTTWKLACPLAVAVFLATVSAPAHAQFGNDQMTQFAPMLEMMKKKLGKKRFATIIQTVGPMMENMMGNNGGGFGGFGGGSTGGFGNFGDFGGGNFGSGDMSGMMSMLSSGQGLSSMIGMIDSFTGHGGRHAHGRRRHRD